MTYTKKQVLPALHHSGKVNAPDMPDVEDKNYTATILKYANLALPFPQLHTNANTIVAAINELYAHPGGSVVIPNPPIDGGLQTESGNTIETESGESIETEQGGGGTVVGPLNSISIDGDIYTIDGGGTNVVANPDEASTDKLKKLKVDNTVYGVTNITSVTANLRIEDWSYGSQTITVVGIKSTSIVWVSPSTYSGNYDEYLRCGIRAVSQAASKLTFEYKTAPEYSIDINICFCDP